MIPPKTEEKKEGEKKERERERERRKKILTPGTLLAAG